VIVVQAALFTDFLKGITSQDGSTFFGGHQVKTRITSIKFSNPAN